MWTTLSTSVKIIVEPNDTLSYDNVTKKMLKNKKIMTLYNVYELCRVTVHSVETVHTELFKSENCSWYCWSQQFSDFNYSVYFSLLIKVIINQSLNNKCNWFQSGLKIGKGVGASWLLCFFTTSNCSNLNKSLVRWEFL